MSAAYFAMAAMPARYALERGDWPAASRLQVQPTRGIGAARLGDAAAAQDAARELAAIRHRLIDATEGYWASQVEIQRVEVLAWAALAIKDSNDALAQMHKAIELENATEKSAITPGQIVRFWPFEVQALTGRVREVSFKLLMRRRLQWIDQLQCGEPPEILVRGAQRRSLLEGYGSEGCIGDERSTDFGLTHLLAE